MSFERSSLRHLRGGVVSCCLLLGAACAPRETSSPDASDEDTTLKGAYAEYFKVGVALPAMIFMGGDRAAQKLAKAQFNRITAENEMKWASVHPGSSFSFETSDAFVRFGQRNGMEVHGHCLVWHTNQPGWPFQGNRGPATRDEVLARLKKHIDRVAGRYDGKVAYWDVVNEALEDDGAMRRSPWYNTIGPDYVEQAFKMAAAAAPTAKLVYNDYNMWMPPKRDAAVALVQRLQSQGIRIDAVGMQGHYRTAGEPSLQQVEEAILAFKATGVEVLITEFDIDPLPYAWDKLGADVNFTVQQREELDPYVRGFPPEAEAAHAKRYADLFRLFVKHSDVVQSVTFWGLSDDFSWLNTWPIQGRTNYPLLFDRGLRPKKAWFAVMNVARECRAGRCELPEP